MKRRSALALLGAGLLARPGFAQTTRTLVDSTGRKVTLPARIERVFVAGPPASVLAYTLARDAMVGWVRTPSPTEKEFLAAPARDLPETGRLTGRGDTVSLEDPIALCESKLTAHSAHYRTFEQADRSRFENPFKREVKIEPASA